MKKLLGWVAVGFLIFYISTNPNRAADTATNIGNVLAEVATNIGEFIRQLTTGG